MTATTSPFAAVPSSGPDSATPMLELSHLTKRFTTKLDFAERLAKRLGAKVQEFDVHAVDDVSLTIAPGEVVGLVGESGCGKTTLGRMVAGITPPSSGELLYRGKSMAALPHDEARQAKLKIQMVFQDPMASLNPRLRVSEIIGEAPRVHGIVSRNEQTDYVASIMRKVGLDPAYAARFPHQFSGGQRQRIGIARALVLQPKLIVADEPVSALDVSIQSQVLNLLVELKRDFGLTYVFVAHDLAVVGYISDRIAVMYLGKVVELAPAADLFRRPLHPYTMALLSAVPEPIPGRKQRRIVLRGDVPSPIDPPSGCRFRTRCWKAQDICAEQEPALVQRVAGAAQLSACHFAEELDVVHATQ